MHYEVSTHDPDFAMVHVNELLRCLELSKTKPQQERDHLIDAVIESFRLLMSRHPLGPLSSGVTPKAILRFLNPWKEAGDE
jgi:hypothetical protein